ncbi:hypothetical protein SAMN00790413_03412 [Deinococcus hopiensis KR-140]|uniref:Uncharacterized protein n=1 Tax=Deinococcus hopiensis KR-140 TaxID=695939 RepID=A0A1W1UWJ2_9DEIO|nr:hypothetical protein SAMN00790413_03412 [Deinococcus hopiensis KR-140]
MLIPPYLYDKCSKAQVQTLKQVRGHVFELSDEPDWVHALLGSDQP